MYDFKLWCTLHTARRVNKYRVKWYYVKENTDEQTKIQKINIQK